MPLPQQGLTRDQVIQALSDFRAHDISWRDGRVLAYVYDAGQEAESIVKEAFSQYLSENALDPTTFPSTLQMEREIVRITADLLGGDDQVVGSVTTGGTESIMLAVKTARDWARAAKPAVKEPQMILSQTAHAAFHKAAHYFGLKLVIVPFDEQSYEADVQGMRAALNDNTILLVASAPNYSHGVIDPVQEIAAMAEEQGILCHVDACIGGFQLAFMRQIGYQVRPFDLSLPGVTSLSADLHKYGYSAKGASILLQRNKELRQYQFYANLSTTAYAIVNPTLLSTKSGGPLAAGWAILHYLGLDGYKKIVAEVAEATTKLIQGINSMPDLGVLGTPDMCIFALGSDTINVFQLADVMKTKGWYLQPQFSKLASRQPNIHMTITQATVPHIDALLADLAAAVEEVKQLPVLDTTIVKEQVEALLANLTSAEAAEALYQLAGIEGSKLPEDTAFINTVLNVLPPPVAEQLLVAYFNDLYV